MRSDSSIQAFSESAITLDEAVGVSTLFGKLEPPPAVTMTDALAVTEASPDANPAAPSSEPMYSVTVALLSAPVVP